MLSATALRRLTALSLTLVCACARTTDSTETGNPPVIDVELIALVEASGEVHVVGEPSAIRPGGGRVEVTTVSSGDVARGDVADDGSFDVAVDGTLDDRYQLRAIGAKAASEPVYLDGGSEIDAPDAGAGGTGDAGTLMCEERALQIADRIVQVEESGSEGCDSNDDCGNLATSNRCPYVCHGVAAAYTSYSEVESAVDELGTSLCDPYAADGCGLIEADCPLPAVACVDAQCTRCDGTGCPQTSCEPCNTPLVTWSTRGGAVAPNLSGGTFTLENCKTLTFTPLSGAPSCSRTLSCVPRDSTDFGYTSAHVQNALGHPDVQAALAAGASFGALTPGGFGFNLGVGDDSIFISDTGCEGAASCTAAPIAIGRLRSVLERLTLDAAPCDSGTPLGAECSLDFDRGTGSANQQAYAFNAAIGTCVPHSYTGEGGNANRFATLEVCRASCPTTAAADACPSDRVFVEEACLQCGAIGGCPELGPICGLPCTDTSECQDEFGLCFEGICRQGACE